MAPRTRSASNNRGRGRGRGRVQSGGMSQPSVSQSPPRQETVPTTEVPNTMNVTQVSDALRELMNNFLATLANTATPQTQRESAEESEPIRVDPPLVTQATRTRVDPSTREVPNIPRNLQPPPLVTPVINIPGGRDDVELVGNRNPSFLDYRRDFNSSKPPSFNGLAGPSEADSWLDHVEEELDNLCVPEHFRVKIAVGLLLDRARVWWRSTKSLYGDDEVHVWSRFRSLFLEEYVSRAHRLEKCKELDRLQQVGMSVQEYRLKFEELCIYKDSFLTNPKDKMTKFVEGLKWQYQNQLAVIDPPNYKELVEAALRLDASVRHIESLRLNQNQKRTLDDRPSQPNANQANSKGKFSQKQKRFRSDNDSQQKSPRDEISQGEIICYYCDKPGHKRPDCPMLLKNNDSRGYGRGRGGNNKTPLAIGDGGKANRQPTSQNLTLESIRTGRVYNITQGTRSPSTREGIYNFQNTDVRVLLIFTHLTTSLVL